MVRVFQELPEAADPPPPGEQQRQGLGPPESEVWRCLKKVWCGGAGLLRVLGRS